MDIDKEKLRVMLQNATGGCHTGHDGWPCETCIHILHLPLKQNKREYWRAVLAYRGDHPRMRQRPGLIEELYRVLIDMNY